MTVYCLIQIGLGSDGIEYGRCTCPRGQYKCHHMACILMHAMTNVSKTDQHCTWMKRKQAKEVRIYSHH